MAARGWRADVPARYSGTAQPCRGNLENNRVLRVILLDLVRKQRDVGQRLLAKASGSDLLGVRVIRRPEVGVESR